ncbi:MAG: glucose 1-dehydrogenase [Bryobacteraceae bacterium]|nr:glucose 1-dehydrogenase [Bryobacteraceae bacterium]
MSRLSGKVAVVTGASKGIGAAIAERLAAEGAAVVVNYARDEAGAGAVVSRIQEKGGVAKAVQADVRDAASVARLFNGAGLGPVDILVNNAGAYEFRPIDAVDEQHIAALFDINVKGMLLTTREAVKAFGDRGGRIINVSSVVADMPPAGVSVYSATKGAVNTITRSLAAELAGRKILVNAIAPGMIETEGAVGMPGYEDFRGYVVSRTALGRVGVPQDLVGLAAFLASDDAAWITGQVISADGGLRM